MATVTTAFPVIARAVPPFPVSPDEFLDRVARGELPHWIYHVRVRHSRIGQFVSPFPDVAPEDVEALARHLGLGGVFTLHPREFVPGGAACGEGSPYAFGYPLACARGSAYLAIAAGMAAAAARRPLPPWLLLSGALEPRRGDGLRFVTTGKLEEKVLLSFGLRPPYQLGLLLDLLYRDPRTVVALGPTARRVRPGGVRLLVVPTDTDVYPLEFSAPLAVRPVEVPPGTFGRPDFAALDEQVRRLAGDDLLLVQAPTPYHALRLLGYPVPPGAARDDRPVRAFRVQHRRPAAPPPPADTAEADARQELEALEYRLAKAGARDLYTKAGVILDRCRRVLGCEWGEVCIAGPHPDWLRVVARRWGEGGDLPHFVARRPAPGVDRLGDAATRDVPRAKDDAEHQAIRSEASPRALCGEAKFRRYQELLSAARAYVKVPLVSRGRVVGAIFLYRAAEGCFRPADLRLAEVLAERVAGEVDAFLTEEGTTAGRVVPPHNFAVDGF